MSAQFMDKTDIICVKTDRSQHETEHGVSVESMLIVGYNCFVFLINYDFPGEFVWKVKTRI